jgi:hypothetical protein
MAEVDLVRPSRNSVPRRGGPVYDLFVRHQISVGIIAMTFKTFTAQAPRQRITQALRYHIGRGREHIRGLSRQFWQGFITGIALCVAVSVLLLMTRT